ncbi:MAG: hypothetical protein IT267_06040, partial [Saprospiraceae bacterium]|nr:hypothetical protein [Saprospiraceae bacterium]
HSNDEGHANEDLCNCLSNSYSKQDALDDYLKKYYGLTDEEWEEYKDDKECKNNTDNKAKVEKFKTDISKAIENELKQLALDFPGVPFDADLFKSIVSKVVLKKTGKLIPLVGVGLDVVELEAAYTAGNYVAMGLSIGSILTEFIPCAMIVDLSLEAASIGNILFKSYKSLSELKQFLGANSSIFIAIFETIDDLDLMDALEWVKKGSSNIGQFALSLGGNSVDEFLEKMSSKLGKQWIDAGNGTKYIDINGIKINFYPVSSSGSDPTIQLIIGLTEFKIRLR